MERVAARSEVAFDTGNLGGIAAEADPMLDPLLQPDQLDMREPV